ncbi:MAG: PP0621 family protein [Arcobacteraceae bacterium]|jgi:uncharacterized protein|nr:PP0621 family protein [Arcobacteraceae bacterium]
MIFKVLVFGVVAYLVYKFFFNKKNKIGKDENEKIEDVMTPCPTCGTYISKDEAILSNGKYFCSQKCLNK